MLDPRSPRLHDDRLLGEHSLAQHLGRGQRLGEGRGQDRNLELIKHQDGVEADLEVAGPGDVDDRGLVLGAGVLRAGLGEGLLEGGDCLEEIEVQKRLFFRVQSYH